jgi:hypothetical protein
MKINLQELFGTTQPNTEEAQITTESTPETKGNIFSTLRDEFNQKVALGGLERVINTTGGVAIALGAGAVLFTGYLAVTELDFTPGEVESQTEVVDPETR